jgi:hypothetical protein
MTGGPHLSLAEKKQGLTPSGFAWVGRGPLPDLGQNGSRGPFSNFDLFSSFLFYFSNLLYFFCILIQNYINQLVQFSTIQHNIVKQ